MVREPMRTPEGDDRTHDGTTPEPTSPDARHPEAEAEAASDVPREAYEKAVEQAVKGVHG